MRAPVTGHDQIACRGCGRPVDATPGYETRTLYCSRACEDREFRRRQREQRRRMRDETETALRIIAEIAEADWLTAAHCADLQRRCRDLLSEEPHDV